MYKIVALMGKAGAGKDKLSLGYPIVLESKEGTSQLVQW